MCDCLLSLSLHHSYILCSFNNIIDFKAENFNKSVDTESEMREIIWIRLPLFMQMITQLIKFKA